MWRGGQGRFNGVHGVHWLGSSREARSVGGRKQPSPVLMWDSAALAGGTEGRTSVERQLGDPGAVGVKGQGSGRRVWGQGTRFRVQGLGPGDKVQGAEFGVWMMEGRGGETGIPGPLGGVRAASPSPAQSTMSPFWPGPAPQRPGPALEAGLLTPNISLGAWTVTEAETIQSPRGLRWRLGSAWPGAPCGAITYKVCPPPLLPSGQQQAIMPHSEAKGTERWGTGHKDPELPQDRHTALG